MKQGRGEVSSGSIWQYCGFQAGAGRVTVDMALISIYTGLWDLCLDHAVETWHLVDNKCPEWKIPRSLVRGSLWSHWRSPSDMLPGALQQGGCEWALSGSAPVCWQTARAGIHLGHPKSSGVKKTQIIKMTGYLKWVISPSWFQQKDIWEQCHQHAVSTRDEQQKLLFDLTIAGYHTHPLVGATKGYAEDRTTNFLQGFQAKAWWWL